MSNGIASFGFLRPKSSSLACMRIIIRSHWPSSYIKRLALPNPFVGLCVPFRNRNANFSNPPKVCCRLDCCLSSCVCLIKVKQPAHSAAFATHSYAYIPVSVGRIVQGNALAIPCRSVMWLNSDPTTPAAIPAMAPH